MATQAKIVLSAEDRASRVIGQVSAQMLAASRTADALATSAGLVSPAFAALASVAGLVAFTKRAIDAADALNDVADATGASIEALSGLERVARMNGGTLDDVSGTLVKFNAALQQAGDPKSDASKVFTALGLSAKELQAADPAKALQQAAVALQQFADDGSKARAVQLLFGRSIKDAAPFLKDLAEAGELQATVTREQAEQAERFNKALFAMQTLAGDAAKSLTYNLVDTLDKSIEKWKAATQAFGGFSAALKAVISGQTQLKDDPAAGLREYNIQLENVDRKLRDIAAGKPSGLGATREMIEQRRKTLETERAELVKVIGYYNTLANVGVSSAAGGGNSSRPSLSSRPRGAVASDASGGKTEKDKISEAAQALATYVEQLDRELQKTQDLTTEQEALLQLKRLGTLGELPQVRQMVLALAGQVQARQDQVELEKAITAELQRQAAAQQALDAALDQFSGRTADALKRAQTARLESRLAAGEVFSPEELDRVVKGIAGIQTQAQETTATMSVMLEQFARNAQDALGQTLEATLSGNFDSIGRLWGNLLIKMAAQAAAAQLGPALFGDFASAKGGSVGGLFGGAISGLFGLFPGKANGGAVEPYSLQRVNERGFEVFSDGSGGDWLMAGARGGHVTPSSQVQMAGGAAPINVVFNNSFATGINRNEMAAFGQVIKAQTMAAVADAQRRRYSGALA